MTIILDDDEDPRNINFFSLGHGKININHAELESVFLRLYAATGAMTFRDAVEKRAMNEALSDEEKRQLKTLRRLLQCFKDGKLRPKVDIFELYESLADLASAGLISDDANPSDEPKTKPWWGAP